MFSTDSGYVARKCVHIGLASVGTDSSIVFVFIKQCVWEYIEVSLESWLMHFSQKAIVVDKHSGSDVLKWLYRSDLKILSYFFFYVYCYPDFFSRIFPPY